MSSWSIDVPFRDRSEPLTVTAGHARVLGPGDDRAAVARQIAISALQDGRAATAGELLDHVARLDPAQRRAMLDHARAECGLPSLADLEFRQAVEAMRRQSVFPANTTCAVAGCPNVPMRGGAWYQPNVRRWHCAEHEHLAAPGDLEPRGSGLKLTDLGTIVADDPADDERERDRAEHEAARQAECDREHQVEADAYRAWTEARDAGMDAELPPHLRHRETP